MTPIPPLRPDRLRLGWHAVRFSTALIVRCIQAACRDLGVTVPSDTDAAYVIGLGLHDALQHAAPGLPPSAIPNWATATATITLPASTNWCCSRARWRCWPT
jgi:hypothetical protein